MHFEKDRFNPFLFLLSVLFLTFGFYLYLYLRPVPADPETYSFLANLRSLTETQSFFSLEEPFPIYLLYLWKSLFGLGYLTSFHSFIAFLYSLSIHLVMMLFFRQKWKLNHYLLVYLASLAPWTHEFPLTYFTELVSFLFLLFLYYQFRLESLGDLILLPILILLAWASDLRFFLLGFTGIVSIVSGKAALQFRSKTTVFYKKKNLPLIALIGYFCLLVVVLVAFSIWNFFSQESFFSLFAYYGKIILHLGPLFLILALGSLLLKTEKELQTLSFSVILLIGIMGLVYWNYSQYNKEKMNYLFKDADAIYRVRGFLQEADSIYLYPNLSNFLYFHYLFPTKHIQSTPSYKSFLFVEDIWQADINELQRNYSTRKKKTNLPDAVVVHEKAAFLSYEVEEKILTEKANTILKKKVKEARAKLKENTPYLKYLRWQIQFMGYSYYQK